MDISPGKPWSDNSNAPQIPHVVYFSEKVNFAGSLAAATFYGIIVILFFQCMSALLNPVNRSKGRTQWGLVAYIVAMFSFVTVYTTLSLGVQSISYVDNREFTGLNDVSSPGPLGYQSLIQPAATTIVAGVAFLSNTWLADGLLLYRCYIIFERKHWFIALPFLMYLASFAMGIAIVCDQTSQSKSIGVIFGVPYYSISLLLNTTLTLMIVIRLFFHGRKIRNATASGLYKFTVTIVIESCALYVVSFFLYVAPWCAGSHFPNVFVPILAETQVRVVFFYGYYKLGIRSSNWPTSLPLGGIAALRLTPAQGTMV